VRRAAALLAVLLPALLAGVTCGKRGEPLPPLAKTPQAVTGVALAQRGRALEVRLVAPRATTAGQRLPVLEIEILRAEKDGPLDKVGQADRRRAAPGEALIETLPLPAPGTVVRVAARARDGGNVSSLSAPVSLTVQPAPEAPSALTARLEAQGVALTWKPPALPSPKPTPTPTPTPSPSLVPSPRPSPTAVPTPTPTPPPGVPPGLLPASPAATPATPAPTPAPSPVLTVYRREPRGEPRALVSLPPTAGGHADTSVAPGQQWCYTVRLVLSPDPVIESAPSEERCLDIKDVFPPAVPIGVAVLPLEDAIEVSWSPSPEMDLAAYRVYRAAGGAPQRVGEVAAGATVFKDATVPAGARVVYTVTAVDKVGNESPPSAGAEGRR
jgi:hypothetical protein